VNIKDVARLSGVSTATVSRVINKTGYVKRETRDRVLKIIRSHEYVPSKIARSLSKREAPFIGVMIPDVMNPFYAEMIKAIGMEADKNGFKTLLFDTNEDPQKEHALLKTVKEHWIKGLLVTPTSCKDDITVGLLQNLEDSGIPVVLLDRDYPGHNFRSVILDNFRGGYDATKTFIREGHKKIAIITGLWKEGPGNDRINGYRQALRDHGIQPEPSYHVRTDFKISGGYKACQKLMALPNHPTAILACGSPIAFGYLQYLREYGLAVGKDISLISFDDILILNMIERRITIVGCKMEDLAVPAFQMLMNAFSGETKEKTESRHIVVPVRINLRGSEKWNGGFYGRVY